MAKLTVIRQKFCDLYIETGNKYQSAIGAGYSEAYAKTHVYKLLENVSVKSYIDEKMQEISSSKIASAEEVMKLLTSTMRGEIQEEVVVVENMGDKSSEARIVNKQVSAKERIKAAELLGKRHQLFTDKISVEGAVPVVIMDDLEE
jgi:Phage terminase, small subunit